MPLKSVGTFAQRPSPPNVGDEYTATDLVTSYKCYTIGTWTADATGTVAGSGTGNTIALWTGVGPSTTLGNSVLTVTGTNATLTYTPTASTSGSPAILTIIGPAHTTLTAAEAIDVNFNLARTVQFTTGGTIAVQRAALFQAPTYSATAATQTLTDAATTTITGAPVAGANVAITRPWSFWIQGGSVRFDGATVHVASNADFRAAVGDANPVIRVSSASGLLMGAGGASALDLLIARSAASVLTINNNAGGGTANFGLVTGALYYESATGAAAAVSGAATGRLRYNNTTAKWQVSVQAGAYVDILTAAAGSIAYLQGGNSFGAAGDLGTNDGFALNIRTTGTTRWVFPTGSFDFIQQGAGTLRNTADNALTIGTATQRVVSISAIQHNVFAASGDANASAQLSTGAVILGVGGATALDSRIRRTAVATFTIDNNSTGAATVVPAADNQNVLGTAPLRWATINCVTINHVNAASDANPTIQVNTTGVRFGAGAASALDTRFARTSASTLTIDNNAGGGAINLSTVTGALFYESSDGAAAAVSGAATGRLRYNNTSGRWQVSTQAGAYVDILTAAAGSFGWLQGGNSFGATGVLGTNDANQIDVETSGTVRFSILAASNTISGNAGLTIQGGSTASNVLTFSSTSNATKGTIDFGTFARFDEVNTRFLFGTQTPIGTERVRITGGATIFDFTGSPAVSIRTTAGTFDMWQFDTVNTKMTITNDVNVATFAGVYNHTSISGGANLQFLDLYDNANVPTYVTRRARGTAAAPSAVLSGDQLGSYSGRGYGATGFSTGSRGRYIWQTSENWTDTAQGCEWYLAVTPTGTTTLTTVLSVRNNGDMRMEGNYNWIPTTDSFGNIGTATLRFATMTANQYNVYIAAADANPAFRLDNTNGIRLGAGGASALDFRIVRTGTKTVQFDDTTAGNQTIVIDTGNRRVGINSGAAALVPAFDIHIQSDSGVNPDIVDDIYDATAANGGGFVVRRARGTSSAPAAVQSGDYLYNAGARARGATAFATADRAAYRALATETWTDTAQGTRLEFITTATGGTTTATRYTIENSGNLTMNGNFTFAPGTDSQGLIGTAALRFSDVVANTHRVFAAASDANASAQLSTGAIILGVGGATALDTRMRRTAAATLTLDNNSTGAVTVVPATDNQNVLGTAPLRWATLNIVTANAILAASDANPSVRMDNAGFYLGAGGASALDCRIRRTAATTITIDNNSTGGVDIVPATTNTGHFGTDALKWNRVRATTVVTGDLEMQDEERNAHWVLREETDRIVAYNKITGKKYEMSMKEIK